MADAVFVLILFYSFIFGARRGFYKEVVHGLALVLSVYLAAQFYEPAGAKIAGATGLPLMLSEVTAACCVWAASFFVAAVVGRLVLKKVRGKGVDDALDEGAEAVADALGGDTTKGPVTLLTDPIASKTGIFYWSDKILGGLLGLVKGALTGYVVFGLCVYADRARGWDSSFVTSVENSYAAEAYETVFEPYLVTFPAYKIASSLGHMRGIVKAVKEEPWRFAALATHPELTSLRKSVKVMDLAQDEDILGHWRKGSVKELFLDEKVRALLGDREFRKRVADVDWAKVRGDVESADRNETLRKRIPDGLGGTMPAPGGEPLPEGASDDAPDGDAPDDGVPAEGAPDSDVPDEGGGLDEDGAGS